VTQEGFKSLHDFKTPRPAEAEGKPSKNPWRFKELGTERDKYEHLLTVMWLGGRIRTRKSTDLDRSNPTKADRR